MIHAVYTDKVHPDSGQVSWVAQCGEAATATSLVSAWDLLNLRHQAKAPAAMQWILCPGCLKVLDRSPTEPSDVFIAR